MPRMIGVGYNLEPIVAGTVPRLGIPGIRFSDGREARSSEGQRRSRWRWRGGHLGSRARGAGGRSDRRGDPRPGREPLRRGVHQLLRHPAWGRAQETYGEEPVLLGSMGVALARGAQRHVMACVKHYACNSMENARFSVDVRVDERVLHEVYLPHFRMVVDAGVAGVMSAYNSVNGRWCGQNRTLLTDILRAEWGFDGFVMSDFIWGVRDPVASVAAGLDLEMPFAQQRAQALPPRSPPAPRRGRTSTRPPRASWPPSSGSRRASREPPPREVVACERHRALAREVAARSMVLLRNEPVDGRPVLPLLQEGLARLAVVGRLADVPNLGDRGSSDVRAPGWSHRSRGCGTPSRRSR